SFAQGSDRAGDHRQRERLEGEARRDHALRARLSRGGRLDVCGPEGTRNVFREGEAAGRYPEGVAEGVSPEVGAADREDGRPRRRGEGRGDAQVPRGAAEEGADRGVSADPAGEVAV